MKDIPTKEYTKIVGSMPIMCVDLIIRFDDRYLLVKRADEPLKGEWWVVGGRVRKGEDLRKAARRKLMEEVGLFGDIGEMVGSYGEEFKESPHGKIHTISFVFVVEPHDDFVTIDETSTEYKWSETLPTRFINGLLE